MFGPDPESLRLMSPPDFLLNYGLLASELNGGKWALFAIQSFHPLCPLRAFSA